MNWDKVNQVIIIIELAQREYRAKKFLQDNIKSTGRNAIILPREYAAVYLKKNRQIGKEILIIEKSAQYYQRKWFAFIKNIGASLIVLEEEGWVPFNWTDYMTRRLPQSSVKFIDEYWCSNSELFENVKSRYPNLNIALTGHPRWNVANSNNTDQVKSFDSDKDLLLLVSTFGMLSSDVDFMEVMQTETGENFDKEFYHKIQLELEKKFITWCDFLERVAALRHPKLKRRLRLHPAEVGVYKKSLLAKYEISKFSLDQDLSESCLVIHPGSTVAFDAEAYGVPNIMLDDGTNINLSADPNNRRMKGECIAGNLISRKSIDTCVDLNNTICHFSYKIPMQLKSNARYLRKPTSMIFLINIRIKILSLFNYKGYRRLQRKLRELKKIGCET